MKNLAVITIALIVSQVLGPVQAAGDPEAGKLKSTQCAACHGADGNSVNPEWPKLAGQHADYLVKQLSYFEKGERENATMKPMANVLDEEGREDVAAYYALQKVKTGAADPELVELGEKIYRSGNPESGVAPCMGCHGPNGAGNPAALYPALRGQHAKYTKASVSTRTPRK
jgi:cytochrome c553